MGKPIANGIANAQKGATPRRCAHIANETARDCVGLGNPIKRFLASTGRGKRRVGRELQMAEHLSDHLGLGDGGNDPERATAAQGLAERQRFAQFLRIPVSRIPPVLEAVDDSNGVLT